MTELNPIMSAEPLEDVEARAADFLQRRLLSRWGATDQAELNVWLDEATSHRVAFLRLEASAARIGKLADLRPPRFHRVSDGWRQRFMPPVFAFAALCVLAMLGYAGVEFFLQPVDRAYSTEVGGHALLGFADHTQIELNTNTAVRYRMTNRERTVWLDRGEAWFRVSHDATRPFSVIVGNRRITDLGTEFLVRRGPDGMEISLVKGRAALSGEGAQTATLMPGDDAVATATSTIIAKRTSRQLADALAWRRGVIVFRNTRLADAVKEFNRYNAVKLVIADPSIADLKFSAELKTDNFADFLQLAEAVLGVRADYQGNDILLSRGLQGQTKRAARVKHGA